MEDKICDTIQEFTNFLQLQAEEMKKHKWIESEKVGHDLGNNAISEWIKKYAKDFREQYLQSHSHSH
jgi:hypothetical protein